MSLTQKEQEELENLEAFEPQDKKCIVCGQKPVVAAVELCGPCTWGESDTMDGQWWDEANQKRLDELREKAK